jgi:hypothetical protein
VDVKLTYLLGKIKNHAGLPGQEIEYSVFLAPRRTLVCDKIFEDEGILGDVNIREFPLYFVPLESDLLSMELESSFEELYLVRHSAVAVQEKGINGRYKQSEKTTARYSTLRVR